MLRLVHLVIGILAVVAFLVTGQVMGHHHPNMEQLSAELRMMYVSRHIYVLAAALVNVVLGLYLQLQQSRWRRALQIVGSVLILVPVFCCCGRLSRSHRLAFAAAADEATWADCTFRRCHGAPGCECGCARN